MTLDFSIKGECHVLQGAHIEDIVSAFPEKLDGAKVLTPASNDLFKRGAGKLLSVEDREVFHSILEKCLYVSNMSTSDIVISVGVACFLNMDLSAMVIVGSTACP